MRIGSTQHSFLDSRLAFGSDNYRTILERQLKEALGELLPEFRIDSFDIYDHEMAEGVISHTVLFECVKLNPGKEYSGNMILCIKPDGIGEIMINDLEPVEFE